MPRRLRLLLPGVAAHIRQKSRAQNRARAAGPAGKAGTRLASRCRKSGSDPDYLHNHFVDIRGFELTRVPEDFFDDPYPYYAALREHDPAHELEGGGFFLSRYEDLVTVYRNPCASSDKKLEFAPKFGASPLYEHHTTSLVFNDPPLHTRVRGLIMGALNQRAIARMEADVVLLVDRLLNRLESQADLIESFAA